MKLSDWPSIRLVIPLVAGIFISDTIENTRAQVSVWCALSIVGLLSVTVLLYSDRRPRLAGLCLSLSFVMAGIASFRNQMDRVRVDWPDRYSVYHGMITSYPLERERSYRLEVTLQDSLYRGRNIYLYVVKDSAVSQLEPGQTIVFEGLVNKPSSEGAGFDYESYLLSHGISGTLRVRTKDWQIADDGSRGNLKTRSVRLRRNVIRKYQEWGLDGNALAVASAVSLGEKRALSDDLREVYSASGVSHVLAVSGLHVGIMCWFLYLLLPSFMFGKRVWIRESIVMCILWTYCFLIGSPVSITRTLIMFSIVSVCRAANRESSALNSLGVAALIMLAIHPSYLFDMSFQLSYCAVLFIVILTPSLLDLYKPRTPPGRYIWRVTVLSVSAQIGTVPIVMYHFSGVSTYVLLANLFVIPAMFVIVSLSMSLWIVGWIAPVREVVVRILTWMVDTMTSLLERVAALPYSHLEMSLSNVWGIFSYYAVVIFVLLWYRESRTRNLVYALASIAVACVLDVFQFFVV